MNKMNDRNERFKGTSFELVTQGIQDASYLRELIQREHGNGELSARVIRFVCSTPSSFVGIGIRCNGPFDEDFSLNLPDKWAIDDKHTVGHTCVYTLRDPWGITIRLAIER